MVEAESHRQMFYQSGLKFVVYKFILPGDADMEWKLIYVGSGEDEMGYGHGPPRLLAGYQGDGPSYDKEGFYAI